MISYVLLIFHVLRPFVVLKTFVLRVQGSDFERRPLKILVNTSRDRLLIQDFSKLSIEHF